MLLPGSIAEYIVHASNTTTQQDDIVNVLDAYIPIQADNATSGTLGPITAENNIYECYASPRITRRRVEAQIQNALGIRNWDPLPKGLRLQNAVPTRNLIGYEPLWDVQPMARQQLNGISWPPDGTGMECRLQ